MDRWHDPGRDRALGSGGAAAARLASRYERLHAARTLGIPRRARSTSAHTLRMGRLRAYFPAGCARGDGLGGSAVSFSSRLRHEINPRGRKKQRRGWPAARREYALSTAREESLSLARQELR